MIFRIAIFEQFGRWITLENSLALGEIRVERFKIEQQMVLAHVSSRCEMFSALCRAFRRALRLNYSIIAALNPPHDSVTAIY